jgi:hypothetical protein
MSQQRIEEFSGSQGRLAGKPPPGAAGAGGAPAGTAPLTQARQGSSVQSMAAGAGQGASWQSIAAANGIENPRFLQPGQFINLNARSK